MGGFNYIVCIVLVVDSSHHLLGKMNVRKKCLHMEYCGWRLAVFFICLFVMMELAILIVPMFISGVIGGLIGKSKGR